MQSATLNRFRAVFSLSTAGEGRGEEVVWNMVIGAFLGFGVWDLELPTGRFMEIYNVQETAL